MNALIRFLCCAFGHDWGKWQIAPPEPMVFSNTEKYERVCQHCKEVQSQMVKSTNYHMFQP